MLRTWYHQSPIRFWWRRQAFYLRRLPLKWCWFPIVCLLLLFTKTPNPFSGKYTKVPIIQDVHWSSLSEMLQMKDQVLATDPLAKQVKFIKHGKEETHLSSSASSILILLYTTIFLNKRYCSRSVDHIFGSTCPSKNQCQWTCDIRKIGEADAIILHAYDIEYYHAHIPKRSETKPNAVWILWSDEPPSIIDYSLLQKYKFNWTISYKSNSEVSLAAYGLFSKRKISLSNAQHDQWTNEQFNNRPNGALWFVSNCNPRPRLEYYYKLKHVSNVLIEGYGRCVDYYPMHPCVASSQCERDYMSNFKFYLSFESITCRDYITEKFYKAFYHGLIPIVVGPERNDYNRLAPKDSFIHIDDFGKDMTKLANYLQEIHTNLTLFSMYHQWRKSYEVIVDGRAVERIRMCELCERLSSVKQGESIYYEDIETFYQEKC